MSQRNTFKPLYERRKSQQLVANDRRARVEMETTEQGCSVTHGEDETGEFVVLETADVEQAQ